jgi:hypothetical protein
MLNTLHAKNLAGGSLTGGSPARKTEKGTKRTLNDCEKKPGMELRTVERVVREV